MSYINNLNGVKIIFLKQGMFFYAFHDRTYRYVHQNNMFIQMWHGTPFKAPDSVLQTAPRRVIIMQIILSLRITSKKEIVKRLRSERWGEQQPYFGQPRTPRYNVWRHFEKYPELNGIKRLLYECRLFESLTHLGYADIEEYLESVAPIFRPQQTLGLGMTNIITIYK